MGLASRIAVHLSPVVLLACGELYVEPPDEYGPVKDRAQAADAASAAPGSGDAAPLGARDAGTQDTGASTFDAAQPSAEADAADATDSTSEATVTVDAASAGGAADGSTRSGDTGAMPCNALRTTGRGISLRPSADQPPERQQGGTIRDGTYHLSDGVVYDPSRAGGVPEMRVETLVVRGDVWQRVAYWDAQPTSHFSQRAALRDTTFKLHLTCGTQFDAQLFGLVQGDEGLYSARGDELVLQVQGGGERGTMFVLTYTRVGD